MDGSTLTYHPSRSPSQAVNENTDDVRAPQTFRGRWKNAEYRRKCVKTLCTGATYWALGLCLGQRGPTFLDVQIITNTDVEAASFFFTALVVGYMTGAIVAALVYDKLHTSLLLLLYLIGMAVTMVAVPWCSIYALMIAVNLACGVFAGGVDTVANTSLLRIWGNEGEMAMQFLHFSFAFGAVIAPLVTKPFLTPLAQHKENNTCTLNLLQIHNTNSSAFLQNFKNNTLDLIQPILNTSFSSMESTTAKSALTGESCTTSSPLTTDVQYAFYISGILVVLAAIPVAVDFLQDRNQKRWQAQKDEQKDEKQPLPLRRLMLVTGALCLFYFVYNSLDETFSSFLATFVVIQLHWSKARAAEISSIYWASYAVGRFFSIFLIQFLGTARMLVVSCSALILSLFGFFLFAQHMMTVGVWVCAFCTGMSMGPVYGNGFMWMQEAVVRVTGRVMAVIMIASSAGAMVSPVLTGFLMHGYSPMWFCYLLLAESFLCLLVFLFLLVFVRLYINKHFVIHPVHNQQVQVTGPSDKSEIWDIRL